MRNFILIFCCVLIVNFGNCQINEDTLSFDIETDSSWVGYQYTSADGIENIEYQDFSHLLPQKQLVVRYKSTATAFIKFDEEMSDPVLIESEGQSTVLEVDQTGGVIVPSLPIDQLYTISVRQSEGARTVGTISTYEVASETSWIDMYKSMYDPVSLWATDPESGKNLFDFVNSQEEWNQLEKTWFLQQYLGYGYALPDALVGQIPSRGDFEKGNSTLRSSCLCRPLRLTFDQSIRPVTTGIQTQQKDGEYANVWGTPPSESFSKAGKRWVAWGMRGPAKYMQAWQETPRCTRGDTYENTMSFDANDLEGAGTNFSSVTGGNQSIVRMIWACIGFDEMIPEDCLCERNPRVRVCYTYSGQALAFSETLGGGWCRGGRGAAAFAQDNVFVAYNENANGLNAAEIIESGRVTAGSGCNRSVNWGDLGASLTKSALYASKALVKAKTVIGIGVSIFYANKLANEISNLWKIDLIQTTGSCGERTANGPSIIDGCFTRTLDQNKESVVMMQSNGKVHVEGKGRHKGSARVLSSFGLTVTMQPSDPDQAGDVCCRTGNGVYSLSHTPGNPHANLGGLQDWARGNFITDGLDQVDNVTNMNGHYGYRDGGGINEQCDLQLVNIAPSLRSLSSESRGYKVDVFDQILSVQNSSDQQLEVVIHDVAGRVLAQHQVSPNMNRTVDYGSEPWPSGMYIARVSDGITTSIEKFYKL